MSDESREETREESDRRMNAVVSRFALKVVGSILGTGVIVLIGWGAWLSTTLIELGNDRAAHNQAHVGIDQRLVAGNERMNLIQADVQKISQDMATLRGEYDAIKRQLRRGGWQQSKVDP